MASGKPEEFEQLEEGFEEGAGSSSDGDDASKATVAKTPLTKRRDLDELLEERKLQRRLRDYDFDVDE